MSGFVRVLATMVLAYPDFLERQRTIREKTECYDESLPQDDANTTNSSSSTNQICSYSDRKKWYLAAHLSLLLAAAIFSILGTMHGPVSLAVPITTASNLLCNVAVMGIVLNMRSFDKAQRTGTYVVFFSVLSLMDVGPRIQSHQDAAQLLTTAPAMVCVAVVTTLMLWAARETWNIWNDHPPQQSRSAHHRDGIDGEDPHSDWKQTTILLVGMTASNVGMATSSKAFATLRGLAWFMAFLYYVLAAVVGVLFSVVSSTLCDQGIFTPLASVALIGVNMMVGMIVWEDHKAVNTWIAYLCCGCLMCCGVYLLAEIDLLDQYWHGAVAETVRPTSALSSYRALESCSTRPPPRRNGRKQRPSPSSSYDDKACDAWQATLTGPPAAVWEGEHPIL